MTSYNLLGLNPGSKTNSKHPYDQIEEAMKNSSENLNSFKEVEDKFKEIEAALESVAPGATSSKNLLTKDEANDTYQIKGDYALNSDLTEIQSSISDLNYQISNIPSIEGLASEAWVNDQGFLTEHQDLSEYAKLEDIPSVDGFASEEWVNAQGFVTDLSEYITINDAESKIQQAITDIIDGADSNFDTFKEIADFLSNTESKNVSDLISAINSNAEEIGNIQSDVETIKNSNFIASDSLESIVLEATTESGEVITYNIAGIK